MIRMLLTAGVASAMLLAPAVSTAATFRVANAGGSGSDVTCTPCATIQEAVDRAAGSAGADTVLVGTGTYTERVTIASGTQVMLVGSGPTRTLITDVNAAVLTEVLTVNDAGSTVSRLGLVDSGNVAYLTAGALRSVRVRAGTAAFSSKIGVRVIPSAGPVSLRDVDTVVPETLPTDYGLLVSSGANPVTIDRSTFVGTYGASVSGNVPVRIRSSRIDGHIFALAATDFTLDVQVHDSVLRSIGDSPSSTVHIGASGVPVGGSVTIDGSTLVAASTSPPFYAIQADYTMAADSYDVDVRSTIMSGQTTSIRMWAFGASPFPGADFDVAWSRTNAGAARSTIIGGTPPAVQFGSGMTTANPLFRDAAAGDYALRRTSTMIDRGQPGATLPAGRNTTDVRGVRRLRDGNRNGVARMDIGATEFQAVPVMRARPRVRGTMQVGSLATCWRGSWGPAAGTRSVRWKRGSSWIPRTAGRRRYRIREADVGKRIRCVVTWRTVDTTSRIASRARRGIR